MNEAPFIRLRNLNDGTLTEEIPLHNELLVGRDPNCGVHILEKSVSRFQCRIYFDGEVKVENLSNTNITRLNEKMLTEPSKLAAGNKLECGRVTLLVVEIAFTDDNSEDLHNLTVYANV